MLRPHQQRAGRAASPSCLLTSADTLPDLGMSCLKAAADQTHSSLPSESDLIVSKENIVIIQRQLASTLQRSFTHGEAVGDSNMKEAFLSCPGPSRTPAVSN